MELCDIVDSHGNPIGRIVERGTVLKPGEFYPVIHVWIRDENNNYLIQQRALHLASGPGVWCTTVGYVISGEESVDGAIREVSEELGLELSQSHLRHIDQHVLDNRFEDIWLTEISRDSIGTLVLSDEVADYKWISRDELEEWVHQGQFFRYSYHGKFF